MLSQTMNGGSKSCWAPNSHFNVQLTYMYLLVLEQHQTDMPSLLNCLQQIFTVTSATATTTVSHHLVEDGNQHPPWTKVRSKQPSMVEFRGVPMCMLSVQSCMTASNKFSSIHHEFQDQSCQQIGDWPTQSWPIRARRIPCMVGAALQHIRLLILEFIQRQHLGFGHQ